MKYLAYSILGAAWLFATVALVFSVFGIFVLIFSNTWWEFGKTTLTEMGRNGKAIS